MCHVIDPNTVSVLANAGGSTRSSIINCPSCQEIINNAKAGVVYIKTPRVA